MTPSGLDGKGQFTSAYDLALIAREDFANADFRKYVLTRTAQMPAQPKLKQNGFQFQNENKLIFNYPGALGGKTGFTTVARHSYVGAAQRNGRRLVVTLLGAEAHPLRGWQQGEALLDWGFSLPKDASVGHLVTPGGGGRRSRPPSQPTPEQPGRPAAPTAAQAGRRAAAAALSMVAGRGGRRRGAGRHPAAAPADPAPPPPPPPRARRTGPARAEPRRPQPLHRLRRSAASRPKTQTTATPSAAVNSISMARPAAASACLVDGQARPGPSRTRSTSQTPSTKPRIRPTTGTTKKPTRPSTPPASSAELGTPTLLSRLPGQQVFDRRPDQRDHGRDGQHEPPAPRPTRRRAAPTAARPAQLSSRPGKHRDDHADDAERDHDAGDDGDGRTGVGEVHGVHAARVRHNPQAGAPAADG